MLLPCLATGAEFGEIMPTEKHQASTTRYSIKHLLAFATLLTISVSLLVQGSRPQSSLWGFGVPAGMTLMIVALFYGGAKFSSKRGSLVRIILAVVIIVVIIFVAQIGFPGVN